MQLQEKENNLNMDGIKSLFNDLIELKDFKNNKDKQIILELMIVATKIGIFEFVKENFGSNINLINKI